MEARGTLKDVSRDWKTGKWIISFSVDRLSDESINEIAEKDLDLIAKKHTEKRSLNANAYFHVLVTKIAEVLCTSNVEVKNRLIREYGAYEYMDDRIPTYLIRSEYEDAVLNKDGVHFVTVGYEHIDGVDYARMAVMRGSHTYDTKEMSRLIDGTVQEAKQLGIETMPPDQLERMLKQWNGITAEKTA